MWGEITEGDVASNATAKKDGRSMGGITVANVAAGGHVHIHQPQVQGSAQFTCEGGTITNTEAQVGDHATRDGSGAEGIEERGGGPPLERVNNDSGVELQNLAAPSRNNSGEDLDHSHYQQGEIENLIAPAVSSSTLKKQSPELFNSCKNNKFVLSATLNALLLIALAALGLHLFSSPTTTTTLSDTVRQSNSSISMMTVRVGGNRTTPSKNVVEILGSYSECPTWQTPPSLLVPLRGLFAVASPEGLLAGGGTDGYKHDPRSVFLWRPNTTWWEPFSHKLHVPRKYACAESHGSKVTVRGGENSDPILPCHLSSETFDFDNPDQGWKLTYHKEADASMCENFYCVDPSTVSMPC